MALPYPTIIPGLRSPAEKTGGLVYFGRMLDKMRLAAAGTLPEGWRPMRGMVKGGFDYRCCDFLRIDYAALEAEVLKGGKSDEELLEWAFRARAAAERGRHRALEWLHDQARLAR